MKTVFGIMFHISRREKKRKREKVATQEIADCPDVTIEMGDIFGPSIDQTHFTQIEPRIHAQVVSNNVYVWMNYANILGLHNFYNCLCWTVNIFCTENAEKKILYNIKTKNR